MWSHLSFITDFVLTMLIISILIHVVNVLHLISPAGRPFVTPWHSITRDLSLCGNLSRAQRRVSVTAQLAPRAGGPQVATAGTVSFHSDLPPLVSAQPPWGAPAGRANGVTTGRQLQVAEVYGTAMEPSTSAGGNPSPKATTATLLHSGKINIKDRSFFLV